MKFPIRGLEQHAITIGSYGLAAEKCRNFAAFYPFEFEWIGYIIRHGGLLVRFLCKQLKSIKKQENPPHFYAISGLTALMQTVSLAISEGRRPGAIKNQQE
jgi:hypothetical protein